MSKISKIINLIALITVSLFSSCDFDHLHYETSLLALVRIDVDWSKTNLDPNGVSAYIYDGDDNYYDQQLSSNPNAVFLKLPAGNYTVVLHNNDISELRGVELQKMKKLESASISATNRKDSPSIDITGGTLPFINEPDDIASYTLRGVDVSHFDIKYHYYKPDISEYEQTAAYTYKATPLHIVHLTRVIAHIEGLQYSSGTPTAILRGMSGGYNFGLEHTTNPAIMEQFKVNTRVSKNDDSDNSDTIFVDYNTFGMHSTNIEERTYQLDVRFTLIDGSYKDYSIDVTGNIRTQQTPIQNRHIIEIYLDPLPEVDGDNDNDDNSDNGEFTPSTDDWIDVDVDLPM